MTKDATEVKIKIGDYELSSSRQTSEIFIKPILNEIDEAIATLSPDQKAEFRIRNIGWLAAKLQSKEIGI